ncbi:DNA mismatch repair endonuclease MutL [Haloplanus aerogenes]|uniref:DNA mismatch repair protein MutL n=1 Tax=Haloplanus aerogenes TaxID=660522 RepID=A0A3M0CSW4_9EURY|nr:DNA mismatch repair endonuclease MutL [Haloplanus aerogenes]AZH26969.1 DNA mismatch repair endonuclease MutL [Haloplanus aerogenes]RMB12621.1 DNA mismatch repair protein MutL [Haloplanus aerogenes]
MSETPTIHALDDATVRRIAAGEVVERPASVVKELIENSLDADASRVTVVVEGGGTESVRVRDDGVGMTAADLERAVEEHTTSKISSGDDLEAVGTLGFRGEALHTIGAVSRLTIRSRPRSGGRGHELAIEGGDVGEVQPSGCPPGTVVEVEDLFYNTPARKKFLKTETTEFDHVNRVVTQYALANPDVATTLEHDGREVFSTEGNGDLESTILAVYGREVASSMVGVGEGSTIPPEGGEAAGADPDAAPVASVSGLVSHPETTRAGREYLSTFVNGRYVTASVLREAVLDAYGGQLASDRYPFAVLFVEVPPDAVDVNVHPRKMEVRFDEESAVADAVRTAIREALLDEGLVRSSAPRGRSAPAETQITPESPEREIAGGEAVDVDETTTATLDESPTVDTGAEVGMDRADRASGTERDDGAGEATRTTTLDEVTSDSSGAADAPTESSTADTTRPESSGAASDASDAGERNRQRARDDETADAGTTPDTAATDDTGDWHHGGVVGPTDQRTLDGETAAPDRAFDRLPPLHVLGQFDDTYVVAETPDGLVLIDQHAADERINYERLRAEMSGETPTQALAEPVDLELTAREAELFDTYRDALAALGFHADRVDDRTVEVRTVPTVFDSALDPSLLRDALTGFAGGTEGETVDAVADALLADLACYPSITGNTSLTEGSVVDLLDALDDCENPFACPHGRPVVVAFDREEIEDRFERDYPGHGGRRAE